jgi:YD repeat-containing protein
VDHGGVNCADGTYVYLTKTINEGVSPSTWSFTRDLGTLKTTETPPSVAPDTGAHAVYTFAGNGQQSSIVFYRDAAETEANKLKTLNTTWAANGTPAAEVTILNVPNGTKQSQVSTVFNSNGVLQSKSEYDYGLGVVGPLIRTTTFTYLNSSNYVGKNILNRMTQQKVTDANGTVFSRTDIAYDCYTAPCADLASSGYTGVTHHDDTNYGAANTIRGNPTQITVYSNAAAGTGQLTTNLSYNILGNVISSADPKSNTTTFSYADSWKTNSALCAPVGGAQAYVTSVTNALSQTAAAKYNSCTGTLASTTDVNGQTTSFTYDSYRRPLITTFPPPDGGNISVSYSDGSNPIISVSQAIDSGKSLGTSTHLDGLGRVVQTTKSTPGGTVFVDTAYDARGNVASVTNPHYSTSSPTDGSTSFLYDGLGRQVKVTNPDGSYSQAAFKGSAVALADEGNGNPNPVEKLQQFDALGRLLKVCEVTSATLIGPDSTPAACNLDLNAISTRANGFVTSYAYDVLDNLLSVNQGSAALSVTTPYRALLLPRFLKPPPLLTTQPVQPRYPTPPPTAPSVAVTLQILVLSPTLEE